MIWYFSATGNSEHVAKTLADQLGEDIAPIEASTLIDTRSGAYTVVVTPVFYLSVPLIVLNCLKRSRFEKGDVLHIVFTSGGLPGGADQVVRKVVPDAFVLSHHVPMMTNYIVFYELPKQKELDEKLMSAEREIARVLQAIMAGEGTFLSDSWWKLIGLPLHWLYDLQRKTHRFMATDRCNSCGLCVKNCPVAAIQLIDGRPVWVKESCENCLKCLHRCPTLAIEFGKNTVGKHRYVYPRIIENRK